MKLNDFQKTTWEKFDVVGLCLFDLDVTMATNFGMPFFLFKKRNIPFLNTQKFSHSNCYVFISFQ